MAAGSPLESPLLRDRGFVLLAVGQAVSRSLALVAAAIAVAGAPFAPARNALVPQVVPPAGLQRANALLQVSFRSAYVVGPILLGPLVVSTSIAGAFAADAATFAVSAVMLAAMRPVPAAPTTPIGLWADLVEGLQVLRRTPDVVVVLSTFGIAILFASGFLTVGTAVLVGSRLHHGAGGYGLLIGIAGISEVVGAMILSVIRFRALALTAVLAWAALGVFRFPLGLTHSLVAAAALLAVTGALSALTDIPLIGHVQMRIAARHLAKVLGAWEAAIVGASAVSAPLAGVVIPYAGLAAGFMVSGGALVALGLGGALVLLRVGAPGASSPVLRS